MNKQIEDPKTKLAELAREHAELSGNKDRKSRFRCRMLAGRATSIIGKLHKSEADRDAAFETWQKEAKPARIGAGFFPIVD